jgi:hypothetical protein
LVGEILQLTPVDPADVPLEVLMDHRELVARMAVADVGRDVVALGDLPLVGGARFIVGGDRRCGAHPSIIAPPAIRLKPPVILRAEES